MCFSLIADVEWFTSLPQHVHACFYNAAAADPATMAAFANCQQTNGGQKCVQDIPAGKDCLNRGVFRIAL